MLTSFDPNKKPLKPKLFVAKPNKQIISALPEVFNVQENIKLGIPNEIIFSISAYIDNFHQLESNPHLSLLKDKYLIKVVKDTSEEWYVINQITNSADDSKDVKTVHAFGLGYELSNKIMRGYSVTSYNATQVLTDALQGTNWSIDYIDASFDLIYRSFNVSSQTALDFIMNTIATTFQGLLVWDTVNRKISMYQLNALVKDRGLRFTYSSLLKNVELVSNDDQQVTRLYAYGKDDLTISSQTPTGQSYIEDLTYFKNIDYMSQSLINAQNAYEQKVTDNLPVFQGYLTDLSNEQTILTSYQNDLANLQTQLNSILDTIDVKQSSGQDYSTELTQKNDLLTQIANKQTQINNIQVQIDATNTNISNLGVELSIQNNFTTDQITERNNFIIEKEISNNNYTDAKDLYEYAKTEFIKMREPQLSVKIDVVNFLEVLEEQSKWNKLILGDICTIYYPALNININAKIVEVQFDYEQSNINLTIANVQMVMDDRQKFISDLYKSISTSTSFDMNAFKYDSAYQKSNEVQDLLNNAWDSARQEILSGINQSVTINERGITIKDSANPLRYLKLMNGVIGMTGDGGNSFKTAITPDKIVAERIMGQLLAGQNLTISTENGDFLVNQNGVQITDLDLIITKSDGMSRILENASIGIKIQKNTSTPSSPNWSDTFSVDTSGNLNFTGNFNAGSITSSSILGSIITGSTINGGTITGSTIQTASTGDRIVLNSTDLSTYASGYMAIKLSPSQLEFWGSGSYLGYHTGKIYAYGHALAMDADTGFILYQSGSYLFNLGLGTSYLYSNLTLTGMDNNLSCGNITCGTNINMGNGCYVEALSDGLRLHWNSNNYFYIGSAGAWAYVNGVGTQLA